MISPPERTRPRRAGESYEEKCERRQEVREALRHRGHAHSTRRPGRAQEQQQSPRQREFLRRRNLGSTAGEHSAPTLLQEIVQLSGYLKVGTVPHEQPQSENYRMFFIINRPRAAASPQEALHRELLLKQKMVILQELLATLLHASEKSWQGQLNEDKLKCKLRALENQLQACTQSYSKECVKKILIEMEDQKQTYEQKAKEALQKMLEDKLQAEQQLQNSQRCLAVTKEDLALWKEHYTMLKSEWAQMAKAHNELKSNVHALQSQLQHMAAQNEELCQALDLLQQEHTELQQHADTLQQDKQLQAKHIHSIEDQVFTTQTPPLTAAKEMQNALSEHPKEKAEENLRDEMQKRTSQLTAKEKECQELRAELDALSEEYRCCLSCLRQCRQELNQSQTVKRQRGNWLPLLLAVIAMAVAAVLANYRL
ncbi:hypothetical protein ASZ78_004039 [Callipepla squamata]|uniref:T3JAM protein n=1 Tax=Callipepla squamata TaxID=9009 RepID=A0A226MHV7_CALSU|nr:hypothetical protein ASZ78_004039 [Callipepla squamata]